MAHPPLQLAFFSGGFGWQELLVIGILALLIFGRRLPEVGRSLGRGIVEFKKGLAGIDDEIEKSGSEQAPPDAQPRQLDSQEPAPGIQQQQNEKSTV